MPPTKVRPADSAAAAAAPRRSLGGQGLRWTAACALSLGCSGPPGAGRSLGEDLGTFAIQATLAANDCGPGALGSPPALSFPVELARAHTELFWDGRGGRIGPELDFEISASTSLELRAARGADDGCSIARDDRIAGSLEPDADGAVIALRAEMSFAFAARTGSTCTAAEQDRAGLPRLPCRMSYTLDGQRTRAPIASPRAPEPEGQASGPR